MPDVPGVASVEELSALPAAQLVARLAEAYRVIGELTERVELLERQAGRESSTSSRPPSSDSPYRKCDALSHMLRVNSQIGGLA